MKDSVLKCSEGADWLVDRIPNAEYNAMKSEIELCVHAIFQKYGYGKELQDAFNESIPVKLERRK
ncbi:hypothetical protein ACQ27_gp369 [Klebsiella phage K64-1]|uniref:hypothetical protein n=1 Tax=Klebsiella phage K64-1 TaxID=1439894 RepID=UPI00248B2C75|nr:hypothetical protein ACQ27_gp369 [Klebsiella phage K64-1]